METLQRIEEWAGLDDRSVFDALFARYFDRVYALAARHSKSRSEAEACCERILELVVQKLPECPPLLPLDAFVFAVARSAMHRETQPLEPIVDGRTQERRRRA